MAICHEKRCARGLIGLLLMLGLAWCTTLDLLAQEPDASTTPEFMVDAISSRGASLSSQTKVDLYTRIPYTHLSFINTPEGFTARYDVMVEAIVLDDEDHRKNLVQTRIWESKVQVDAYAATQREEFVDFTTQSLNLDPGRYILEFQLEDEVSGQTFVRELVIAVRDMNQPVSISDLTLIQSFNEETNTIVPTVDHRLNTEASDLKLFYEVYAEQQRPVRISQQILRVKNNSLILTGMPESPTSDETGGEFVFTRVESPPLQAKKNQYIVTIPVGDLKMGTYKVRIRVEDEMGNLLDTAETTFAAQWNGLNEHIEENLNQAISQMEYIAKKKDLSYIREAGSSMERHTRFMQFWQRRDPTPGTNRNERMEEYYYRVAFANRQYSTSTEGWKTDRGYVMVNFGEPEHVERHPYSFDTEPYEIWYYYRIGRRFIFIDRTGLGDYELLRPIWDEANRIR